MSSLVTTMKIIATNKQGYHKYEILDTYEAGLVLTGPEIKAIRAGKVALAGSYAKLLSEARLDHPELYWIGGSIHLADGDEQRSRKLLLHDQELRRLVGKLQEKGLTLVPLKLYLKRGLAKLELGLGKGKKLHDKRQSIKTKEARRASARALRKKM